MLQSVMKRFENFYLNGNVKNHFSYSRSCFVGFPFIFIFAFCNENVILFVLLCELWVAECYYVHFENDYYYH